MTPKWYYANHVNSLVAGDFDGDGIDDVISKYNYTDGKVQLHFFKSLSSRFQSWSGWTM